MNTTATVCIGNSDNKLTQEEWSRYCAEIHAAIDFRAAEIHFHGFTAPNSTRQSACWVIGWPKKPVIQGGLISELRDIACKYRQDAIAITLGETRMLGPQQPKPLPEPEDDEEDEGDIQPCCENESRNLNGGCDNCGDPCL